MDKYALWILVCAFWWTAVSPARGDEYAQRVIALDDEKTLSNYQKLVELGRLALTARPDDFEVIWRHSKACRWYAGLSRLQHVAGWEGICVRYGKEGMMHAEKAISLRPDQPHGYFYYGLNAAVYAEGVSFITAVTEGLKDKIQYHLEKAYQIDKYFANAGSILCLGRFWQMLPWPLTDPDKSLRYYREYQQTAFFNNPYPDGPIYLAELLIDLGGERNFAEAAKLLSAVKTDRRYYREWLEDLQGKIKRQ